MDRSSQPLSGKRVVVTRAPEQAQELIRELVRVGAEVLALPTVSFAAPAEWELVDAALRELSSFDWILFTSRNAVRFLAQRARELEMNLASLQSPKPMVAAVGPATAKAASEVGLKVEYTATHHSGQALARELWTSMGNCRVLLPRSDRGDERLPNALREAGARVTEVIAYRTAMPKLLDPSALNHVRHAEVDTIVFASPSAFQNLGDVIGLDALAELSTRVQFAAIGPTTARALRDGGARVEIESNESSAAGLADSIAKYYQRQTSAARRA